MEVIAAPNPVVPESEVLELLTSEYSLSGKLTSLVSERDQNFRLNTADGRVMVVKIANAVEPAQITDFQIQTLIHLEQNACPVPVPRVIRTTSGDVSTTIHSAESSHVVRLVSYVPGRPIEGTVPGPDLAYALGQSQAQLDQALRDFTHPGESQVLLWDMQRAGTLRSLMRHVKSPDVHELVLTCLNEFEQRAEPAFSDLRKQVIHNDLNPENILIDDSDPPGVAGVIDFGDMVRAPLIIDVAIAASYLRSIENGLELTRRLVAGFDSVTPLEDAEREVFFDLIRMRLATTLTILHWRQSMRSAEDPYLQKSLQESGSERFLRYITMLTRDGFASHVFSSKN
jgi:Ser/Thr protein kinase RdoA (MazF antagonist)